MADRKNPILCSVDTCKHHDGDHSCCKLNSITVCGCADAPSVNCAEQSMCKSFEK